MSIFFRAPILGYEPGPEHDEERDFRYLVDGILIERFKDEAEAIAFFHKDLAYNEAIAREENDSYERKLVIDAGYSSEILLSDRVGELKKETA